MGVRRLRRREALILSNKSRSGRIAKRVEDNMWQGLTTRVEINIVVNGIIYSSNETTIKEMKDLISLDGEILDLIRKRGD